MHHAIRPTVRLVLTLTIAMLLASIWTMPAASAPPGAGFGTAARTMQATVDLEAELEGQLTTSYAPGNTLSATFRVFEFSNVRTNNVLVAVAPPTGATALQITCAPEDPVLRSTCPSGQLGTSFTIPTLLGSSGVFITVTFVAPINAGGTLELGLTVSPPTTIQERIPSDNRDTATWAPVGQAGPVSLGTGTARDLEVELQSQPLAVYGQGDVLLATFRVFEFQNRPTDNVSIVITVPSGVATIAVSCVPGSESDGSTCPDQIQNSSFTVPTIAGSDGVLIIVAFAVPVGATGPIALEVAATPPAGLEESVPGDNTDRAVWN